MGTNGALLSRGAGDSIFSISTIISLCLEVMDSVTAWCVTRTDE